MTAGQQAMPLGGGKGYQVTVGNNGAFGYYTLAPPMGSILPDSVYKGQTLQGIFCLAGGYDLGVQFAGVLAQALFTAIQVQDSAGVIRNYTSASAAFTNAGQSLWKWGAGASPVWNVNFQVRSVRIIP